MSMQDAAPMRDPQSYRGHGGCSFGLYIYIYIHWCRKPLTTSHQQWPSKVAGSRRKRWRLNLTIAPAKPSSENLRACTAQFMDALSSVPQRKEKPIEPLKLVYD